MVYFIKKRLQVFVSSTYSDLILERQAAVEAILSAGHIPAGMELFTSGDESQMDVINQWIDESDVFLLILGGRYGSIEPKSGKSYVHLEYEYALKKEKPLFACVIEESALEEKVKKHGTKVIEKKNQQSLVEFRTLVLSKISKFWNDSKDIKIAVSEKLSQLSRNGELIGWVRGDQSTNSAALANEIARLSKENSVLRQQVANNEPSLTIYGLSYNEMKKIIDAKDILHDLIRVSKAQRPGLGAPDRIISKEIAQELQKLGLALHHPSRESIELTEGGISFLNRLEYESLLNNHNYNE